MILITFLFKAPTYSTPSQGFIPNGTLLTLFPPLGKDFVFNNNLTAGTTVVFYMEDSRGRDGGVADLDIVSFSDDTASCVSSSGDLNSAKATPNSTLTGSSPTTTTSNLPSTGASTSAGPKSSNVAVIAGAAAGGGVTVVILGLFVRCCTCRRRRNDSRSPLPMVREWSSTDPLERARQRSLPDITLPNRAVLPFGMDASSSTSSLTVAGAGAEVGTDLSPRWRKEQMRIAMLNGTSGAFGYMNAQGRGSPGYTTAQIGAGVNFDQGASGYGPRFYAPSRPIHEGLLSPGMRPSLDEGDRSLYGQSSFSGSAQRVIVHTDSAQARLMNDEQPLELPPTYSEGRRSIPGLLSSTAGSSPTADTRSQKEP